MTDLTHGDLERMADRIEARMREGFAGINDRLDDLNGRTRRSENKIAVLEDRSPGRVGMISGGVVSGTALLLWYVIQAVSK